MSAVNLQLVSKSFGYTRRRKKWVVVLAVLGISSYGAYRAYRLPCVVNKRNKLLTLLDALFSLVELVSDSAEAIGLVSKDLKEFILSNSDQIPNSFMQLSKIPRSNECSESVTRITRALTVGILRGYRSTGNDGNSVEGNYSFSGHLLDKIFSDAGSGFASVIVGSFARNLIMAAFSGQCNADISGLIASSFPGSIPKWVCGPNCREHIGDCIQLFVSTAMAVYLDKTMHSNQYDEIFSGLTNPRHELQMRDMLESVCNGAVETFVKTSHQVMTTAGSEKSNAKSSGNGHSNSPTGLGQSPTSNNGDEEHEEEESKLNELLTERTSFDDDYYDGGWMSKVSHIHTLAEPSYRIFLLDMIGRVTFETVRCFLDFLLEKLTEALRRGVDVVYEELIDRALGIFRRTRKMSSTAFKICLSLSLHILGSPRLFILA